MCRSLADGGRRCAGLGRASSAAAGSGGNSPVAPLPGPASREGLAEAEPGLASRRGLSSRRLAMLREAASSPRGGIVLRSGRAASARDEEALEAMGFAASIDDCGHVHPGDTWTAADEPHSSHPHFFRITAAGRQEVLGAAQQASQPREAEELGLE